MFGSAKSDELIPWFGAGDDLHGPARGVFYRNHFRIQRDAGKGRFVNHRQAFQFFASESKPPDVPDSRRVSALSRAASLVVGQMVMHAFVDPGETAVEQLQHKAAKAIVRGWKPSVALRRHRASLDRAIRIRQSVDNRRKPTERVTKPTKKSTK